MGVASTAAVLVCAVAVPVAAAAGYVVGEKQSHTVTRTRMVITKLPRDRKFDSQLSSTQFTVVCKGYSTDPKLDPEKHYPVKRLLRYRIVTDCRAVR